MTAILELQNVCKQYEGSSFKLNEVSFTIPNGSIVGFIGSNGAGKTTTMGTIIGTLKKRLWYHSCFRRRIFTTTRIKRRDWCRV